MTATRAPEDRILARVVFPTDGDLDVLPLYVDGQQVPVSVEDGETLLPVHYDQNPDQVLGRRSYRLGHGTRTSFATYFNAFPAGYWRRWSTLQSVQLSVRTSGDGTLIVYRSSARGSVARVSAHTLAGDATLVVPLPLNAFGDGGWYWFDLVAGREDLVLASAEWIAGVT